MTRRRLLFIALLTLCISSGFAATADKYRFALNGLTGSAKKNATDQLSLIADEINKKEQRAAVIQHALSQVSRDIEEAVKPYGYFEAKASTRRSIDQQQTVITVAVKPGPRIMLSNVTLSITGPGRHIKPYKNLLAKHKLKPGSPLNTEKYNQIKQALFNTASQRGFFDAKMQQSQIKINLNTHQAEIIIRFDTGKQYVYGKTSFSKNRLKNSFLRRYIPYKSGKPYNNNKVQTLRSDLINSEYFNSVTVNTPVNRTYYSVPVKVKLTDRNSKHYVLGAGYGTDTGPRALLGFNWVPVNKYGHRFTSNIRASQRNNYFTTSYIIPGSDPVHDQYAISAGYSTLDIPIGQAYSKSIGVSYTNSLGAHNDWQQIVMLQYINERYNLSTQPFTNASVLMPSIEWTYVNTNKPLNPSEGFRFYAKVSGADKRVISKTSFFQAQAGIKYLYTLHASHTRFLTRYMMGHTIIDNINNMPLSLQLLAGGADSVRGYSYQSIGPGKNMVVGSVEIQQRIKGNFYVAGFYDFGSVDNKFFSNVKQGVGPAVVYLTPVGTFELSLARPLIPGKHWRIQFSMGPSI